MKRIVIASENPVKIKAALDGFQKIFPEEKFEVEEISVAPGINSQPKSSEETLRGAMERVENASKLKLEADFWIGMEGGVEEKENEMESFAWAVIKSKDGNLGKGKTGSFFLAPKMRELIKQGKELGEVDDIIFGQKNSKQKNGAVGILTDNAVNRAGFYTDAVIFALIPFKNKELYF